MLKRPKIKPAFFIRLMRGLVWLFPLFALVIAGYLFYDYLEKRGPLVQISFADAAGVEAQKTPLRFRGINVGVVESLVLTEDTKDVVIKARLNKEAEGLAVEGSRFVIVEPQVDFGGVRGLETLFKGPYIRIDQGKGGKQLTFRGTTGETAAEDTSLGSVTYILKTDQAESLGPGDPVTFRGIKIGSVVSTKVDSTAQMVELHLSIERKYVKLIRTNSVFWQKVGVQAKLGLFASELKINSLESLLKSGIGVSTPNGEPGKIANAFSKFDLMKSPPKDWEKWSPKL